MKLEQIVPWGRSFDEYRRMFSLTDAVLATATLGCGDGPASFNAELTAQGGTVVSVDPLYIHPAAAIQGRIAATAEIVLAEVRRGRDQFLWDDIPSPEDLLQLRLKTMTRFLEDYPEGLRAGRYVPGTLPDLPFTTGEFELVLCSHLLFTYSGVLDEDFHVGAIRAMLAAGEEARIFPLLSLDGSPSPHVTPVRRRLEESGFEATIVDVAYEFQRGGNQMLRVSRRL